MFIRLHPLWQLETKRPIKPKTDADRQDMNKHSFPVDRHLKKADLVFDNYGAKMIIARAPLRVSFVGGGTDLPEYFRESGGEVISTAIDKFSYVSVNKLLGFFDHSIRISYSKTELVDDLEQIQHRAVKECLKHCDIPSNIEINCISDLPARTGLGSSGSFVVALLQALHSFKSEYVSPEKLAYEAIHIERNQLKDNVGCQDQFAASVGGFNRIRFYSETDIRYEPIVMPRDRREQLSKNLLMFYTGIQRSASEVTAEQVGRTKVNIPYLNDLKSLVEETHKVLVSGQKLVEFGKLLETGWQLKQNLASSVSNSVIDDIYSLAKKNGAVGGKLLGAGGGGFLLFYVEPENHAPVRKALANFKEVTFQFEDSGSQIIYHKTSR